jgi:hypothetical protein
MSKLCFDGHRRLRVLPSGINFGPLMFIEAVKKIADQVFTHAIPLAERTAAANHHA